MATVSQLANVSGYKPGPALTAAGGVRSANLGIVQLYATMQGQRVLTEHFMTVGAVLPGMLFGVVDAFGYILRDKAKEIHSPNILTKATYDSIATTGAVASGKAYVAQTYVTTPYAKFLEFGFVHYRTGQWIFNPFMIPAADAITPAFVEAINDVLGIAANTRFFTSAAAMTSANDTLGSVRQLLYSYSKFAGDIQILGFGGLSASRGIAIKGAKGIGNIQAAQGGTLGARIARLGIGRVGGSAIRGGSFGGGIVSGPTGRIYNRLSGRAFGGSLSQI